MKFCPLTRYQGSKYKLLDDLKEVFENLEFNSVLDGFGGSGVVSYLLKSLNKEVYFNDILKFNSISANGFLNNKIITNEDIESIFEIKNKPYKTFIFDTFKDIYYLDEENKELDILIQNINEHEKRDSLFWCLVQVCLMKRPFNLFHRKNLYIRTSEVKRSFGNKKTWDKSFKKLFIEKSKELNNSIINGSVEILNEDILNLKLKVDLVYLDSPYISLKSNTKYKDYYHFCEGLVNYNTWDKMIDYNSKHLKMKNEYNIFEDKLNILKGFETIIKNHKDSKIVISYRKDGIPSVKAIVEMLQKYKKNITIKEFDYKYALSKNNTKEVLIIGV